MHEPTVEEGVGQYLGERRVFSLTTQVIGDRDDASVERLLDNRFGVDYRREEGVPRLWWKVFIVDEVFAGKVNYPRADLDLVNLGGDKIRAENGTVDGIGDHEDNHGQKKEETEEPESGAFEYSHYCNNCVSSRPDCQPAQAQ